MLTRRERLMLTLRGQPVDRPAVNFYEIGGFKVDPDDPDPDRPDPERSSPIVYFIVCASVVIALVFGLPLFTIKV